jgi:hypothetical protein
MQEWQRDIRRNRQHVEEIGDWYLWSALKSPTGRELDHANVLRRVQDVM